MNYFERQQFDTLEMVAEYLENLIPAMEKLCAGDYGLYNPVINGLSWVMDAYRNTRDFLMKEECPVMENDLIGNLEKLNGAVKRNDTDMCIAIITDSMLDFAREYKAAADIMVKRYSVSPVFKKKLLSICVPSYNRGHRAYKLVKSLLELPYGDVIEIIVSNNGSTENTQGYEDIKKLDDSRLVYNEFSENQLYWGNINQVVKMSSCDYCLIVSDEDELVAENLEYFLELLQNNPELGVVRPNSLTVYKTGMDEYARAGEEAISDIFINNNYVSGIILNRSIVTDEVVDRLAEDFGGMEGYTYYTHMFLEAYAALYGDYLRSSVQIISEGEAEVCSMSLDSVEHLGYARYEIRLKQVDAYVKFIEKYVNIDSIKVQLFINVCFKTIHLVRSVLNIYKKDGYDVEAIRQDVTDKLLEALDGIKDPAFDAYRAGFARDIPIEVADGIC